MKPIPAGRRRHWRFTDWPLSIGVLIWLAMTWPDQP